MGGCQSKKAILDSTRSNLSDDVSIVFVLGGPGSGKGTQCEQIVEHYGCQHISAGDLLREEVKKETPLGKQCSKLMQEGKLVPVETTLTLLKNAMAASDKKAFLIDGFPRSIEQASKFESEIKPCTTVIFFECSEATMTARILERGKTSGRTDDTEETIKKRLDTFTSMSAPVADHYEAQGKCHRISAERAPDQVFKEVQKILNEYLTPIDTKEETRVSEVQESTPQLVVEEVVETKEEVKKEEAEAVENDAKTNEDIAETQEEVKLEDDVEASNETQPTLEEDPKSESVIEEVPVPNEENKETTNTEEEEEVKKLVMLHHIQAPEVKDAFASKFTSKGWTIEWKTWEDEGQELESAVLSANAVFWTPSKTKADNASPEDILQKAKEQGIVLFPSLEVVAAARDEEFVNKVIGSEITPTSEDPQKIEILLSFNKPLEVVSYPVNENKTLGEQVSHKVDDAEFAPLIAQFVDQDLARIESVLGEALPPLWSVIYNASPKRNEEDSETGYEFLFSGLDWNAPDLAKSLPLVEVLSIKIMELLPVA